MLKPLASPDFERLREFLREAGYTHEEFRQHPTLAEIPSRRTGNLPLLLDRLAEPTARNLLVRWFCVGVPAQWATAQALVPKPVLVLLLQAGMLVRDGETLVPQVMLTPCDEYLFAADTAARMESDTGDVVLWPNPTTRLLHQFAMRRSVEATLDLGAGCGIQAVLAAHHSGQVTATDLNPRGKEFGDFNARLNGAANIEYITGDTFQPVEGRTFDVILANPPFFVTPSSGQLYCENSMDLDLYCRRVVREAPQYLTEGGNLQMVFEWVAVRGQSWQERLAEWLVESGCDAWILHTYARGAAAYARERIRQTSHQAIDESQALSQWLEYYGRHGVEEIHGGILTLRRRSGRNWIRVEEMPLAPTEPFGDSVGDAFAGFDYLTCQASPDELLQSRPKLSPHAQLEQLLRQVDGRWQPIGMKLSLARGIPSSLRLEPSVAEFVGRLDGTASLGELADELARRVQTDPARVRQECSGIIRKLVERRFLLV
jgi:Methyltransferase small domain